LGAWVFNQEIEVWSWVSMLIEAAGDDNLCNGPTGNTGMGRVCRILVKAGFSTSSNELLMTA